MSLFNKLINVEEGTKINGKVHHWSNISLEVNNFYKLSKYKGTFQLVERIEGGHDSYSIYVFERKAAPKKANVTKLKTIEEKDIIPPVFRVLGL